MPITVAPSPPLTAAPVVAPVPLPPSVGRLSEEACSWSTPGWGPRQVTRLRLRPGGPVFAWAAGGRAQLQIPVGREEHGILDVSSAGLALSGVVEREQLVLYPARPFSMNGVVYPTSTVALAWTEGFAGAVAVTASAPAEMRVTSPPLSARRPCADVTLDRGTTLAMEAAIFAGAPGSTRLLRAGQAIPVFSDPTRPADVKLRLARAEMVRSFGTLGAFSRIGMTVGEMFVAGWVETARLSYANGGGSGSFTTSFGLGLGNATSHVLRKVACPSSVALVAEAEGERATVGYVERETTIEVIEERGAFSRVQVANRRLRAHENVAWLVRDSDLRTCRTLEP